MSDAPLTSNPVSCTEKDAARYEWLREHFLELIVHTSCSPIGRRVDGLEINPRLGQDFDPQSLDQAIDSMLDAERLSDETGDEHG